MNRPYYYTVQFQAESHLNCRCFSDLYPPPIKAPAELVSQYGLGEKYIYYPCPNCKELVSWKRSWWAVGTANDTVTRYSPQTKVFIRNIVDGTRGMLQGKLRQLRTDIEKYDAKVIASRELSFDILDLLEQEYK